MRLLPVLSLAAFSLLTSGFARADDAVVRMAGPRWSGDLPVTIASGDSLGGIAGRYATTAARLAADNGIEMTQKLKIGQVVTVHYEHLTPADLPEGITINLAQRLLYLRKQGELRVWAVAPGKPDWQTPVREWTIQSRQENKTWMVPKSIQAEMAREGQAVKTSIGPGPDNPLGKYWLGLSIPGYGIHGTIAPSSLYHLRSHGCVRMHNDDIAELFPRVARGDAGRTVYWPVLLEVRPDGGIFVEAHPDAYKRGGDLVAALRQLADTQGVSARIDWLLAAAAVKAAAGRPVPVQSGAAPQPVAPAKPVMLPTAAPQAAPTDR